MSRRPNKEAKCPDAKERARRKDLGARAERTSAAAADGEAVERSPTALGFRPGGLSVRRGACGRLPEDGPRRSGVLRQIERARPRPTVPERRPSPENRIPTLAVREGDANLARAPASGRPRAASGSRTARLVSQNGRRDVVRRRGETGLPASGHPPSSDTAISRPERSIHRFHVRAVEADQLRASKRVPSAAHVPPRWRCPP